MVVSNDEYPFWARWYKNGVLVTDITSVNYEIFEYNDITNQFDSLTTGTVGAATADGKWIVPFTVPANPDDVTYLCQYTPVGGTHNPLSEQITTEDGIITNITNGGGAGCGTESHSGTVCAPDGSPLENVIVKATPYGNEGFVVTTSVSDANGDYTLTGLHENFVYNIYFNAPGYWGKIVERIVA